MKNIILSTVIASLATIFLCNEALAQNRIFGLDPNTSDYWLYRVSKKTGHSAKLFLRFEKLYGDNTIEFPPVCSSGMINKY